MENFFILGQVNEALNPPEDLSTYDFKDREVKLFRPRYDPITGTFLHSFHKKRMPNSFSRTFFNRHRIQYESGALQTDFSEIFYFHPSITDRVGEINRHLGSVNLYLINIPYNFFEIDEKVKI